MKPISIGRGAAVLRGASDARQSTCMIRRSDDHRKRDEPSLCLVEIIEIIWEMKVPLKTRFQLLLGTSGRYAHLRAWCASRSRSQRLIEMMMNGLDNSPGIVTRLGHQ